MSAKANAARWSRFHAERAEQAQAKLQAVTKSEIPQPIPMDEYLARRLERVRKQLDRLDEMILEEEDPQKLDRLVSASSRLEEQERKLSGRFAPGSTKPSTKPTRETRPRIDPIVGPSVSDTPSNSVPPAV